MPSLIKSTTQIFSQIKPSKTVKVILSLCFLTHYQLTYSNEQKLSDTDLSHSKKNLEQLIDKRYDTLDKINFHPTILPIIMNNKDTIELSSKQVERLNAWRKEIAPKVKKLIKDIADARIKFNEMALDISIHENQLIAFQDTIFGMQRQLLNYKLQCRKTITDTFNPDQFENFIFVLSEERPELLASMSL